LLIGAYSSIAQINDSDILFNKTIHSNNIIDSNKTFKTSSWSPFLGLLKFYKSYISEQIAADCAFNPSCSSFSYNCIKNIGLIRGLLLTADRLSRCHEDAFKHYPSSEIINNDIIDTHEMYR
jgi:putative component of membrane protein insertase Oxa1/YidC/SpoIIIJ protein YidD